MSELLVMAEADGVGSIPGLPLDALQIWGNHEFCVMSPFSKPIETGRELHKSFRIGIDRKRRALVYVADTAMDGQ